MCKTSTPEVSQNPEMFSSVQVPLLQLGHGLARRGKDTRDMTGQEDGLFLGSCHRAVILLSWEVSWILRFISFIIL